MRVGTHLLDGCGPVAGCVVEHGAVELGGKGLGSDVGEERMLQRVPGLPQHDAEAAWVPQPHPHAIFQNELEMVVR